MTFLEALWGEVSAARTFYVLVAIVVLAAVMERLPLATRRSLRLPFLLLMVHVALVITTAAELTVGYDPRWIRVASQAFELLAVVNVSTIVAFHVLLPLAGVVLPRILVDIFSALAVVGALIVVGQNAGLSVAGLITTSAVLTAVIGFALQDTLGNVMGGLALQMDRSVKVGDWISLGQGLPTGLVVEIRWRYTSLETRDWETVVVPNSVIMKNMIVVLGQRSHEPVQLRRRLEFWVDYRTPPGRVINSLNQAFAANPIKNVATQPVPHVLLMAMADSVAHYQVRYWLTDLSIDDVTDSAVRVRTIYALRRAGIEPAIPAQAVFLTTEDERRAARKADEEANRRKQAIASVDLFAGLSAEVQAILAAQLRYAPYSIGEAVTHEGDASDVLYIVDSGTASVQVGSGTLAREVARLGPGQFFGEMGLMTGEVRSATIVATDELRCFCIDKAALERAFVDHPALAEQFAEVLATRRITLEAVRGELSDERNRRLNNAKQDLVGRISRFFGLPRN